MKKNNRKLVTALICYAALIAGALFFLLPARSSDEKFVLGIFLAVFALLIFRTIVHTREEE